jgi:glucose-6-phosphate isomerase
MTESGGLTEALTMLRKYNKVSPPLSKLLAEGPQRFARFSRRFDGLLMDFSRTALDDEAFAQLLGIGQLAGVAGVSERLFGGERINVTEDRPVLHHLWRSRAFGTQLGAVEAAACREGLDRMRRYAGALHAGRLPADAGQPVHDVVHVGIGGSLLGPRLLCEAFPPAGATPRTHFVSSVDAFERERLLTAIDPRTTVVILVSKSFTTSEVLAHGRRLLEWQSAGLAPEEARKRRFAVSASPGKAERFGVPAEQVLPMGEWTGGRYSLWSPVGFTAAIVMGPDAFDALCAGGAAMDRHFCEAPPGDNLPLIHGLLGCWHRNVCDFPCQGIAPYDGRLKSLPAWLQQVQMESNGKSVSRSGAPVELATSPIVFGECGTDAQHALFQAFHQGTQVVPLDFIGVVRADHADRDAQVQLLSHLLAQATALALGRSTDEVRIAMARPGREARDIDALLPHRAMPGNRPSTVFLLDRLDPATLGSLLVLYEHSVFVQSVVWDINAFDQWGVELGKELCERIVPALSADVATQAELGSLDGLIREIRARSTG